MIVRSRAPLRLGLGGGGTDVSPFSDLYGGCVLNAAIGLHAYATIEPNESGRVRILAADLEERYEGEAEESLPLDGKLDLHKSVYNHIVREFNRGRPLPIDFKTHADVPMGSGLGSSSTLVVAMVACFAEYLNLPLGEYDVAQRAFEIERIELGLAGGKQDQYAAAFGGFNFIEFYEQARTIVNPLRVKQWIVSELEASLVLYYTGASRESGAIIQEQAERIRRGDPLSIKAMMRLKREAILMKEWLLKGELRKLGSLMHRSWSAKKATASNVTNARIESVYRLALDAGAWAGKVSGAGGGGFMIFLVDPVDRMRLVRALGEAGGRVLPFHFSKQGTQAWRIR